MKKRIAMILILSLLLVGCTAPDSNHNPTTAPDLHQSTSSEGTLSQTDPTNHLEGTLPGLNSEESTATTPTTPDSTENTTESGKPDGPSSTHPSTEPTDPSDSSTQATQAPTTPTQPEETTPTTTPTTPPPTDPPEDTIPTRPPETTPEETEPPQETEPPIDKDSYEFKRQVAAYAVQYLNQYRAAAGVSTCTVLPGMTLVAEYRADQLTYNYSHDTADKREALAHYQYGRWIDATVVGLSPEDSYYEADAAEAICAGFNANDAEAMGKKIADLIRNSSSHWSYVGSSRYSYIGIGVEYRAGTAYGWYGCVMVGTTNYG